MLAVGVVVRGQPLVQIHLGGAPDIHLARGSAHNLVDLAVAIVSHNCLALYTVEHGNYLNRFVGYRCGLPRRPARARSA